MEINNLNNLKKRFVKDFNLPINIFDEEIFNYYINLYDFFPKKIWEDLLYIVETKFNSNAELWLEYCSKIKDNIINSILNSEEYKKFNESDMSRYAINNNIKGGDIYNELNDGKYFISIDLKKANFQALKYANVINDKNYYALIERFGGDEYLKNSKQFRQIIFGNLNGSRISTVERFIIYNIYKYLKPWTDELSMQIERFNNDEIIYSISNKELINEEKLVSLETEIADKFDIEISVEFFQLNKLSIYNCNNCKIDIYEKYNLITNEKKIKKAPVTYYPQIYKLWKGLEISEIDRNVYIENQVAVFKEPLYIKK